MHFDTWRSSAWDVFTHGLFLTYPHHDAGGLNTYSYVRCGAKLWAYINLKDVDDKNQEEVLKGWTSYYSFPMATETFDKGVVLGTILLERGAVL